MRAANDREGFLFPATYAGRRAGHRWVDEQVQALPGNPPEPEPRRARRAHLTAYDVVTIASMVEREAQVARGAPAHRRGDLEPPAQGTPPPGHRRHPALRAAQLDAAPAPVRAAPGPRAAANPAHVGYLYYVVKPGTCGRHAFSSTAASFDGDVARYNAAWRRSGCALPTTCKG